MITASEMTEFAITHQLSLGWAVTFTQDTHGPFYWIKADAPLVAQAVAEWCGLSAEQVAPYIDEDDASLGCWIIPIPCQIIDDMAAGGIDELVATVEGTPVYATVCS